ncbi:MAG: hypothetical protein AAF639_07300 [Chloroflexota bacterium]
MAKRWLLVTHEEYFNSLRNVVADADRFNLVTYIWSELEETDNPIRDAEPFPNRPGCFTLEQFGYLIPFEVAIDMDGKIDEGASKIRLLPIFKL